MNYRLHNSITFLKKRSFETVISPAFYVMFSAGIILSFTIIGEFLKTIGSDGVIYSESNLIAGITSGLSGIFGETVVDVLFSEGPYLFAFYVAFFPFMLFLVISSAFKFGHEQSTGALELITCGPVDTTSIFLGSLIRDFLYSLGYQFILLFLFLINAGMTNLALGSSFMSAWFLVIFFSLAMYAFGALASVITPNAVAATGSYLGMIVLFAFLQAGTMMESSNYFRDIATILTKIVQWLSPIFYLILGLGTKGIFYFFSMILLLALTYGILLASHFIARKKGVRA